MTNQNYTTIFVVDKTPEQVFDAINNVRGWWNEAAKGNSEKLNDEFSVQFGDVHYSKHKLIEVVPGKKIVWLVTDSSLSSFKNKSEWTGTKNIFEIENENGKTVINFTHIGLTPGLECFGSCSGGWNYFLPGSLLPFITTGKGKPNKKTETV